MTINARAALKELDINPRQGIIRAVQSIGESIMQSPDPISYANAVIVTLGGQEQLEFARARIMAKAMVELIVTIRMILWLHFNMQKARLNS